MESIYINQGLIRNLTLSTTYSAGRNITGRITVYHRGGGTKPRLRLVDYKRVLNLPCRIIRIEKDTHRTAYIALVIYYSGIFSYILAPHGISQKSLLMSGAHADIKDGNHCPLLFIPAGVFLHNIELKLQHFGQIIRSAGNKGLLLRHKRLISLIRLPSGEIRFFNIFCSATLGTISHITHKFDTIYTKAGHIRHIGYRPHVRGCSNESWLIIRMEVATVKHLQVEHQQMLGVSLQRVHVLEKLIVVSIYIYLKQDMKRKNKI